MKPRALEIPVGPSEEAGRWSDCQGKSLEDFKQSSLLDMTSLSHCSSVYWVQTDCLGQECEGGRLSLLVGSGMIWTRVVAVQVVKSGQVLEIF